MGWGFWIVVGIVVAAVVWLISIYNGLVAQRTASRTPLRRSTSS